MSWVRVQGIGPMARPEAVACLKATLAGRAAAFTVAELAVFAERLHDDPILLGLFGRLLRADPSANPLPVAENVIGRVVEQAIGELAAANHSLPANYLGTLNRLSVEMIRRKVLHPRWSDVEGWFGADPQVRTCLAELVAQGHVCRLAEAAGVMRLEFRHDRILEYHLAQAASGMLCEEGDDRSVVSDPFFTPFVGRAIARAELPGEVLERVNRQNPVALIAAVPYLTTSSSAYADRVVELGRSWLGQASNQPNSMRYDALWTLARANSPRVIDITEGMSGNQWVWEARLRNGDASTGAVALSGEFFPAVRYEWLESLIEEARTHHHSRLSEQLRTLLRSTEMGDQQRRGALCLAGYLGDPGLAADVKFAWENAGDQRKVLLAALWAGLRCAGNTPAELVGPMMPHILTLQHDESGQTMDELGYLLQELGFASRHGFGEHVLTYLVELGTGREEFREIVASILDDIDHPIAIRYVVRLLAEAKHRAEQSGGFSPWALIWSDRWKRKENGTDGRLSFSSVAVLRSMSVDEQDPGWLQDYAFSLWARHVDDLAELASVTQDDRHYETAVWQRALRNDRAVAAYVLAKLNSDRHWFRVVPHVWGNQFEPALDAALDRIAADPELSAKSWSNQHYDMSHLLRDIPTDAAERILVKHWSGVGRSPLFIQAALYHGTARCRELVAVSLAQVGQGVEPFEHIGSFFGFFTQELMDRLTDRHLDTLLPYLRQLDDVCLGEMLDFCRRFDHWDYARRHLEPEMRRRVPLAKPDFDGGALYIVRMTRHWFPTDEELLAELEQSELIDPRYPPRRLSRWWDDFIERGDPDDRAGRLLFAWLARNQSPARFVVVAGLLRERGKRRDFEAPMKLKPVGDDPEVIRAATDAEFAVKRRALD